MTKEPKLNREFLIELEREIEKEGCKLEKQSWGSKSPYKEIEEFAELLEKAFGSLSTNAAIAVFCLRKGYSIGFYEKIKKYLRSVQKKKI